MTQPALVLTWLTWIVLISAVYGLYEVARGLRETRDDRRRWLALKLGDTERALGLLSIRQRTWTKAYLAGVLAFATVLALLILAGTPQPLTPLVFRLGMIGVIVGAVVLINRIRAIRRHMQDLAFTVLMFAIPVVLRFVG